MSTMARDHARCYPRTTAYIAAVVTLLLILQLIDTFTA